MTSAAGAGDHLQLQVGDQLQIIFHSTYWTAPSNSDPTVLAPVGDPVVAGRLSGCVAGMGCGTVTITFAVRATGTSIIGAHRDTCGEALACSGTRGDYQLTVTTG